MAGKPPLRPSRKGKETLFSDHHCGGVADPSGHLQDAASTASNISGHLDRFAAGPSSYHHCRAANRISREDEEEEQHYVYDEEEDGAPPPTNSPHKRRSKPAVATVIATTPVTEAIIASAIINAADHPTRTIVPDSSTIAGTIFAALTPTDCSIPTMCGLTVVPVFGPKQPGKPHLVRLVPKPSNSINVIRNSVRRACITYNSLRTFASCYIAHRRRDLFTGTVMRNRGLWLICYNGDIHCKRIIGAIPGREIGDIFWYRVELCVVGLHGQLEAGIDSVTKNLSEINEPIATSIVYSGEYEDDEDNGNTIIYTGHGGKERNARHHNSRQKLEDENLALRRSHDHGIEVRVIRKIKTNLSPSGNVYVYDGLFKVVNLKSATGQSGYGVYQFRLERVEGQEEMGSSVLKLAKEIKLNPLKARPRGHWYHDISKGKEKINIPCFNDITKDLEPAKIKYVAKLSYPPWILYGGGDERGCHCSPNCRPPRCECAQRNGGCFAYDGKGVLLRGKPLIYECGPLCRCPPSCPNRVTEKGLRYQLEVFRSSRTDWGVRSLDLIQAGSFICEFVGTVVPIDPSNLLSTNVDGFIHPNRFPPKRAEWGDLSTVVREYRHPNFPLLPQLSFMIDIRSERNVAYYLRHGNSPNVFVQFVLFDHYNESFAHLMIFAMENIPPLRELRLDYGRTMGGNR